MAKHDDPTQDRRALLENAKRFHEENIRLYGHMWSAKRIADERAQIQAYEDVIDGLRES